jgi:hypothetical protein
MSKETKFRELIKSMQESGHMEMLLSAVLQLDIKDGKLKYNEDELEEIEKKINVVFPEGHTPLATTLIPFGFYLGELIKKKIPGAEWKYTDTEDLWDLSVEYKTSEGMSMQAKPFMRAQKFWKKREDRMLSFIRMICFNTEVTMDKEYWSKRVDEEGWITMAWGDMYRLFIGDKGEDFTKAKGAFHNGTFGDGKY